MSLITLDDYWTGPGRVRRDELYPLDLSTTVRANAMRWVAVANDLAERLGLLGIALSTNPKTGTPLSSGWRPPKVNDATSNAAARSLHISGQAGDVYDPDGRIDDYLMAHQELLADFGVWIEHPEATPTWSHWQIVPQGSFAVTGKRVYWP